LKRAIEEKKERKMKFNDEKIIQWSNELFKAMEYLHSEERRIIHRDIKPAYIFI